ncbi:S49 family peptidase, partial [Escherichia coli]
FLLGDIGILLAWFLSGKYFVANPSTLTGSIGIFGVITTVENSLDSIGVHTDGVSTSPLADVSITRALPP